MGKRDVTTALAGWTAGLALLYTAVPSITALLAAEPLLDYGLAALIIVFSLDLYWLLRRERVFVMNAEAAGAPVEKSGSTGGVLGARIAFVLAASIVWIDAAKANATLTGWVLGSALMFLAVLPWLMVTIRRLCQPR